ncbi:MAG: hypothetical protein ACYSSI_05205 [Planctomycetota bacterium]|jgi:hypothetical protein
MKIRHIFLAGFVCTLLSVRTYCGIYQTTLNGLSISIDEQTGCLVELSYPSTGVILQAKPDSGGLLDIAFPVDGVEPMRLASRFSKAQLTKGENEITIFYEKLGPSRTHVGLPEGNIKAQIKIKASGYSRSMIMTCEIQNNTNLPIPQIMFPDLWGIQNQYQIQSPHERFDPFKQDKPVAARKQWMREPVPYTSEKNWGRIALCPSWLDIGNYTGGLSIFHKQWGWTNKPRLMALSLKNSPSTIRLCFEHLNRINPGQTWKSGEFWFTPHLGGWAKGIEVFRNYVEKVRPPREIPLPQHIRDDIGFRTIWMIEQAETDPKMADYRYRDIPGIARECAEHGIHELVMWFWWDRGFCLPVKTRSELGTRQEFIDAVRKAKQLGVNVTPFYTITIIASEIANARYGSNFKGYSNWNYHTEFVPHFRPHYLQHMPNIKTHPLSLSGVTMHMTNKAYQDDVFHAVKEWIDEGIPSVCWDVYDSSESSDGKTPDLIRLTRKIRKYARSKDPESTFSGEIHSLGMVPKGRSSSLELDSSVLDYTWNWQVYREREAFQNVMRTPRINMNVIASPTQVKIGFCAGLFLNIMPNKLDRPNGTAMIKDNPALSLALKEVVKLRRQFLPYFVKGHSLGDSILKGPSSAFVRAYQLEDKMLITVLNHKAKPLEVTLSSDLGLWLPRTQKYKIKYYDSSGQVLNQMVWDKTAWSSSKIQLGPLELALLEIIVQKN